MPKTSQIVLVVAIFRKLVKYFSKSYYKSTNLLQNAAQNYKRVRQVYYYKVWEKFVAIPKKFTRGDVTNIQLRAVTEKTPLWLHCEFISFFQYCSFISVSRLPRKFYIPLKSFVNSA